MILFFFIKFNLKKNMYRKLPKSLSTQNMSMNKKKRAGSVAPISLKGTQTNFRFREPYFAPLHNISQEIENNSLKYLKSWKEKRTLSPPKRRSFHTSCIYKNYLYIFGGKDITEGKLNDIMRINLELEDHPKWENITPNNENIEPLAYHTGTLIGEKYYIIGGNDKYIRQSSFIYIYDLENNNLEKIKIEKNEDICYLSMHTADYYEPKKEIILFGGYSEGEMLNTIFKFNIETNEITKIEYQNNDSEKLPLPRTGHTSFIYENNLYVFGGSIKDGGLLNDLWKLDLEAIKWEEIISNKNEKKDENNGENNDENKENKDENRENEDDNVENNNGNNLEKPSPRSGHSLLMVNNEIYIFGGKIGMFQECNDLWKYDISGNKFILLHDTTLEQFTDEEIEEFKREENNKKKKKGNDFHFITRKEQDDKINPYSKLYSQNKPYNKKLLFKSQSTKDFNKNEFENEIFVNPGYYQMKHSSIFNLDNKDINAAITILDMFLPYKTGDKGIKIPLPRDGQSLDFYNNQLLVFGGDRNKYPFNDFYIFNISN
jgi:hypothetical protein